MPRGGSLTNGGRRRERSSYRRARVDAKGPGPVRRDGAGSPGGETGRERPRCPPHGPLDVGVLACGGHRCRRGAAARRVRGHRPPGRGSCRPAAPLRGERRRGHARRRLQPPCHPAPGGPLERGSSFFIRHYAIPAGAPARRSGPRGAGRPCKVDAIGGSDRGVFCTLLPPGRRPHRTGAHPGGLVPRPLRFLRPAREGLRRGGVNAWGRESRPRAGGLVVAADTGRSAPAPAGRFGEGDGPPTDAGAAAGREREWPADGPERVRGSVAG